MKWAEANVFQQLKYRDTNFEELFNSTIISIESYRRQHEFLLIYHTNYRHHLHHYLSRHNSPEKNKTKTKYHKS